MKTYDFLCKVGDTRIHGKGKETRRIETKDRDDSRVDVPAPAVVFIITFLPIAPRRRPPTLDPENESSAGMNGLLSSE